MDLNELKNRWKAESDKNITINEQSMEQLQSLLKEKTAHTLQSIKERYKGIITYLLIGLLFNISITPFLHFLLGDGEPKFRITPGGLLSIAVMATMGIIVVFFYWLKYADRHPDPASADIKTVLISNIAKLQTAFKQETLFLSSIFIALFILSRLCAEYLGHGKFEEIFHKDILIALGTGFLILFFYIFKRRSVYQLHTKELKSYLNELNEKV